MDAVVETRYGHQRKQSIGVRTFRFYGLNTERSKIDINKSRFFVDSGSGRSPRAACQRETGNVPGQPSYGLIVF